jgi:hypothetical protein
MTLTHPSYAGPRTNPRPVGVCPCCSNGRWDSPGAHRFLCDRCYGQAVRLRACVHEGAVPQCEQKR